MQISKRHIRVSLFILFMVFVGTVVIFITNRADQHLQRNARLTIGVIDTITSLRGSPDQANYSFEINHNSIHNRRPIYVDASIRYLREVLTRARLVVAYDASDYSNNNLLLSKRDYERFGLTPDSATLQLFKKIDSLRIGKDAIQ
jgi:hypothetical protein